MNKRIEKLENQVKNLQEDLKKVSKLIPDINDNLKVVQEATNDHHRKLELLKEGFTELMEAELKRRGFGDVVKDFKEIAKEFEEKKDGETKVSRMVNDLLNAYRKKAQDKVLKEKSNCDDTQKDIKGKEIKCPNCDDGTLEELTEGEKRRLIGLGGKSFLSEKVLGCDECGYFCEDDLVD